jgi:hypothetical protein
MGLKIFINFKCKDVPYGGGNQFVLKLVDYLQTYTNHCITYSLEKNIDVYFLIDIRKGGEYKKYSFEEIYLHKQKNGGRIIYRINDCDITRDNKTLESLIVKNINKIDYFVFNSDFIKEYYFGKYAEFTTVNYSIVYNTSDGNIFFPKKESGLNKIKIVTHHWSDNINKGYEIYHQLYNYCLNRTDVEFRFIGRKFNDKFIPSPHIEGPYKGKQLADKLRDCDMYITASVYDACPMHVLEGLSCGLPILYINHVGGGKDICMLSAEKVGESFNEFTDLILSIEKIKNNYSVYVNNILKNIDLYNSDHCYKQYNEIFTLIAT